MKSEIKHIRLDHLHPNPYRDIEHYPIIERKVEALMRSMKNDDVGMWPSIIARPRGTQGYEMAFGHHRWHAASRLGIDAIPVIVMSLNNDQMLRYMGGENGEDFNTDFLVLLNTWEAGRRFIGGNPPPIDIARKLGWVANFGKDRNERMTATAKGCSNVLELIEKGYMSRDDLGDLSLRAANDIAQRALSMMETLDQTRKLNPTKQHELVVEHEKKVVADAARDTMKDLRQGKIGLMDAGRSIVNKSYHATKLKDALKPLFDKFCYQLAGDIRQVLDKNDVLKRNIEEVIANIQHVTLTKDVIAVSNVSAQLAELRDRVEEFRKRINKAKSAPKSGGTATPLVAKRG